MGFALSFSPWEEASPVTRLEPVVRIAPDHAAVLGYLRAHCPETIFSLHDLVHLDALGPLERPDVLAYAQGGMLVAVQCLYGGGRWLPHWLDSAALPSLLEDAQHIPLRWGVGSRRVMDPLLDYLATRGRVATYDQVEVLCAVDRLHLTAQTADIDCVLRRARPADAPRVAELRQAFEDEYFPFPVPRGPMAVQIAAAKRLIQDGVWLAEVEGIPVATAAVEADIPELTHIAAVFTRKEWRGRGLARAVVSAMCVEALHTKPRATLLVRPDNAPAWRAYRSIGFSPWDEYRICQF